MSFFKKVNDNDDIPQNEPSESKGTSFSDVNTEISDLDSLLDKVLAEKKADKKPSTDDGEIRSVKVADLLSGKSSSSDDDTDISLDEEENTSSYEDEPETPEKPSDLKESSTDDSVSSELSDDRETDGHASDFLGEEKHDTGSAASILAEETPYESSADDVLSGHEDHEDSYTAPEPSYDRTFSETAPSYDRAFSEAASSYDNDYSETKADSYAYQNTEPEYDQADRAVNDNTEDALLVQIDAFRDKAIRLSGLINANQKKVMSLEAEVKKKEGLISDKENQIAALQDELSKKQKEADALVTTVESQVDRMLVSVKREMSTLNNDISDKVSRENRAESDRLAGIIDKVNSSVLEIKDYLAHSQEDTSLEDMKQELSEKIHSENVKVYRNIQDTMKEMDHSEQIDISIDEKYRSLKHRSGLLLVVLIINIGISAVMLLMRIGIIPENILSLLGL